MPEKFSCPSCGFDVISGQDRCEHCLHSLMQVDLPQARKDDSYQQVMMNAPIGELVTGADLLVCKATDSVEKVVKIFQKENLKCILVYESKKLVGIVSIRDLLRKVAFEEKKIDQIKVEDIMTLNPEFVKGEEPIASAINKMALGGFRNLPVLNNEGIPLTIISIKDVLQYLSRRDGAEKKSA